MTKYRNVKTRVGDIVFDSKKEAARYMLLRDMEKQGKISDLNIQVKIPITVQGVKICTYIADFRYSDGKQYITEDVKSEITRKNPVYRLKKKLIKALYNIEITEV
jgi:hypothetical protein